jgi:hypothetical protein
MPRTADAVHVKVTQTTTARRPPSTKVKFVVSNRGTAPIWLVDDGWPIWKQRGRLLEVSLARGKMQPGAQAYGYFDPVVTKIGPGKHATRTVELAWPLPLSRLWNAMAQATPEPGDYRFRIRVGYGLKAKPDRVRLGEEIEAPVLRWQQEAVSDPHSLIVPPYDIAARAGT